MFKFSLSNFSNNSVTCIHFNKNARFRIFKSPNIKKVIARVNDFDLHDFTTDEKYKEKRSLNLFNKKPVQPPIEKKNSIDSLLKEESGQTSEEIEITEEEDSKEQEDNEE